MRSDVETYVRRCPCHLNKALGLKRVAPLQPIAIGRPFEHWAVDHCGPFPPSRDEKRYILNMTERFTKICELAAVETKAMDEAAAKFEKRVICRWGTPKSVIADNAFTGAFASLCEAYGIRLEHSLPQQKNTVGLVERRNRTVEEQLRNYVNGKFDDWPDHLPALQFAICSGPTVTHGFSPLRIALGQEPALPIQRQLDSDPAPNVDELTATPNEELQHVVEQEDDREWTEDEADRKLLKGQKKMKKTYDAKNNTTLYEVGTNKVLCYIGV